MEEKTISVSLGDPRIKDISEVIANKTCNKILDAIIDTDLTASEVASKLKLAQNTVDYNIKKLLKAGLVEKADSWWSVKGKKMPTYQVSNKTIVIAPKKKATKTLLTTLGLTGLGTWLVHALTKPTVTNTLQQTATLTAEAGNDAALETVVTQAAPRLIAETTQQPGILASLPAWSWFLIGALLTIGIYTLTTKYLQKRT